MPKPQQQQPQYETPSRNPMASQERYRFDGVPGLMLIVGPRSATWFVRFTSPIDGKNKLLELGPATWQHDPLAPYALDLSAARAESGFGSRGSKRPRSRA